MPKNNSEPTLSENANQFEALFNYATIGIIVTNSRGEIVNFNHYAERHFGYSKEEILGKNIEILIPQRYQGGHVKLRDGFYKHPEQRSMGAGRDLHARHKDNTEFPVEVSLSNYTLNGEVFAIAFLIDISVRKKIEATVIQQRDELERVTREVKKLNTELEQKVEDRTKMLRETLTELEKSKDDLSAALENEKGLGELKSRFVTTASHEFRTPLSTILSSTFLLQKYNTTNETEKREKHLHRIRDAVADMKSILEDFLSLGKLEEGLIRTNQGFLSVAELKEDIHKLISEMELMAKQDQQIHFHYQGEAPAYIDRQLFRNILMNLISNAIKFSPENSIIKINLFTDKQKLVISVEDNGIGISEEDKQHLFERFFRAKNAINIQGTGLGLHIIAKYLELMNGHIEMKSELNKGSIFTVIIPSNNIQ